MRRSPSTYLRPLMNTKRSRRLLAESEQLEAHLRQRDAFGQQRGRRSGAPARRPSSRRATRRKKALRRALPSASVRRPSRGRCRSPRARAPGAAFAASPRAARAAPMPACVGTVGARQRHGPFDHGRRLPRARSARACSATTRRRARARRRAARRSRRTPTAALVRAAWRAALGQGPAAPNAGVRAPICAVRRG